MLEAVSKLNSSCFPVLLERQIAAAGVPLLGSPLLPFRPCVRACIPSPLSSLPSPLSPLHLVPALLLPTSNNSPRTRFQVWCDKFWCRAAKVDDAALFDLGDLALVDLGDHAYNAGPSGVCRHAFVVRRRNTCVTTRSSALCCRRCSSVRTAMPAARSCQHPNQREPPFVGLCSVDAACLTADRRRKNRWANGLGAPRISAHTRSAPTLLPSRTCPHPS